MPTALSDPTTALCAILGAVTVILGIVAHRRQKRSDAINFLIPAVALAVLMVIDWQVQSPREQIETSIREMETATQNKKHDDVFKHVSDKFQYRSLDKKGLQNMARLAESVPNWEGIKVTGLERKGFTQKDETTAEQKFVVQPLRLPSTGDNPYRYDCTAVFKKEGDRWMLTGFKLERNGQEVGPPGM